MAHARRERQRVLALDVRFTIWTQGKFDAESFVKQGQHAVYGPQQIPDTPAIRAAREALEKEREQHGK